MPAHGGAWVSREQRARRSPVFLYPTSARRGQGGPGRRLSFSRAEQHGRRGEGERPWEPGRDLGYFLGNSLLPEDRRKSERELVATYHDALIAEGVKGHSLEECFDDYRYGQFQGLLVTVLASVNLTHTDRGDEMFMAMSSRACEAIHDLESLDLL